MNAIAYTPDQWTKYQRACHEASNLDDAFVAASCLAGGWYQRPVIIYGRVDADNCEHYQVIPADQPAPFGWKADYKVERL